MLFLRYLTQRLGLALITLLIVSAIVFAMTAMLPGDVATRILGRAPDPQQLAILRERLGLDQPLLSRYFSWLAGIVVGDFGTSLVSGQPVAEVIGRWNGTRREHRHDGEARKKGACHRFLTLVGGLPRDFRS